MGIRRPVIKPFRKVEETTYRSLKGEVARCQLNVTVYPNDLGFIKALAQAKKDFKAFEAGQLEAR